MSGLLGVIAAMQAAVDELETRLADEFDTHPQAAILRSAPGLGPVLAARVLAEIGDDPTRFTDPNSLRAFAGTAPVTIASGRSHYVKARKVRNKRLGDACHWWAFAALTKSSGARAHYDRRRAAGDHHNAALRNLANKLLGRLWWCLANNQPWDDDAAWPDRTNMERLSAACQPKGEPEQVKVHDFIDTELGKANPYGVDDVGTNTGWVSVGTDHDTAAFAVNTIATWWQQVGKTLHPNATRLMISADGGGSNGYRTRQWKTELAELAAATGLTVTVCHLPPGTSKWNKIEHRLFSHISMNRRGRPLTSHEVIVETIAATTTSTGLTVRAELDRATYPTGVKIPDAEMKALENQRILTRHDFHGEWNYTLNPKPRHARTEPD